MRNMHLIVCFSDVSRARISQPAKQACLMVSTFRNNNDDNEDSNMGATGQAGGLNPVFLVSK